MNQADASSKQEQLRGTPTEADERLDRFYGKPASADQIRLHFETLVKSYIEGAERYPSDTRSKLTWYTNRPLLVRFFANETSVFFVLMGGASREGAEPVESIEELSHGIDEGSTILTSGTAFNGRKIFSIEAALKEASSRLGTELKTAHVPSIITDVKAADAELKKPAPDIGKLRQVVNQACDRLRTIEADKDDGSPGLLAKPDSCPFIAGYVHRVSEVEGAVHVLEKDIDRLEKHADRLSDDSKTLHELLRTSLDRDRERTHLLQGRRGQILVTVGILVSLGMGIANIIIKFLSGEGG